MTPKCIVCGKEMFERAEHEKETDPSTGAVTIEYQVFECSFAEGGPWHTRTFVPLRPVVPASSQE